MKKSYLLSICFLLVLNVGLQAQKRRTIHNFDSQHSHTAHVANSPSSPNACSVDTILLTTQAQINNFTTNYPTCTNPKYLIINGAGASPAITSLAGLSSITQVINKLEIRNTSITSLAGLSGLTQIGDTLLLERNNNLTSIGLNNLTELGAIYFSHLPALTSVAGLSNNIHKTGFIYLDSTNVSNLAGLNNFDTLTTSNGGLSIFNSPVVNLNALNNLKQINGYVKMSVNNLQTSIGLTNIKYCWGFLIDNLPILNSAAGLTNNLTSGNIGTFWFINTGLANLTGLEGLTGSSNFYVSGNPNLTNINGLQNLSGNIGYGISFYSNPLLNSLSPLSNINHVDNGTIEISYNNITNLDGFQNVVNIGKGLWLAGNSNLTMLNNLNNNLVIQNNIDPFSNTKDSVRIYDNPLLALCSDTSICYYLSGGGTAFIDNNAVGCNTIAEIQASCTTNGINCNDIEPNDNGITAIPLLQNTNKCGHVGYQTGVDGNGDPVYDEYDIYKIVMPYDGSINIDFTAKNDSSCFSISNTYLDLMMLDANFNERHGENVFNWNNTDTCNSEQIKSLKLRGYKGEEFYIRLNGGAITYTLNWHASDQVTSETEYNGDYANSIYLNPTDTVHGLINYISAYQYDNADFYKTKMPVTGNIRIHVKVKNRQNYAPGVPNGIRFTWKFDNFNSSVFYLPTGNLDDSATQVIDICGVKNDTVYFKIEQQTEANEYYWSYEIIDTLNVMDNYEPNNTLATGTQIVENEIKTATINFMGNVLDFYDSYKTKIPKSGSIRLKFTATDTKCNHGNFIVRAYNINNNQIFGQTFTSTGAPGLVTTFSDSANICGINANDSIFFQITSTDPFSYSFSYKMVDTIENIIDIEPNNSFATATQLNIGDSIKGRINYPTTADANDYYKTVMPYSGNVKIFLETKNIDCNTGAGVLYVYDRRKDNGPSTFFPINNIPSQQIRRDTFNVCGLAADTLYFLMSSNFNTKLQYKIRYEITDTTTSDIEDNGTFNTATSINALQQKSGTVRYSNGAGTDTYDYYKTNLPNDGTLKIIVQATNMSCANGQWLYLRGYDRRQGGGQIFEKYLANNSSVSAGQTVYDTILICGRAADSFYLRFEASSSFKYQWSYVMVDTSVNDAEPNGDFAIALPIAELQTKVGHIKYYNNGGADDYDYYKTLLPKEGTLKILVQATNMGCANGQWVYLRGYDKRQGGGQIFEKYLANNSSVSAGQTVYDTILICGRAADSFYLRFEASSSFKYQWSYVMVDTSVNDAEPNGSFAQAIAVGSAQTKKGHIKYYANGGADDLDYYKFVFTTSDSLKLQMQATNKGCANNQWIYLRAYDKNFNQLFEKYFAANSAVAAGQTVFDSIKILVNAPDTIYLRYEASSSFQYQFTTNPRLPSASFSIVGDTTPCFGIKTYKAVNVFDDNITYHWVLSGGGILNFTDSIATVNWNTNGAHNLSLYISNNLGNSPTKQKTIVVNNNAPAEVPVLNNAARTLFTSGVPSGAVCNWYKSGVLIAGVIDSIYYAQDSGTYVVRFVRPCGTGVASNPFYFPLPAQAQTISFVHTANITMSLTAKAKLLATASSGLSVSYQLISGNAIIVNDTVYVTSVGTVIVKAVQQGSDVYAAAAPKYDTITVVQGPQTITFNAIPAQIYSITPLALLATASSGLPVTYNILSGNATISGSNLIMTGAGNVIVQANQIGNANYTAATAVQQTFCIGVRTLTAISGSVSPCLNNYIYTTDKIPAANYVWTLSSGGTITTNRDTAFINWTTAGTHTITVKANSACDVVYSNIVSLTITTSNNPPTAVINMLPINNAIDQQLPLNLSWQPGLFTVNYDLYVWDSAQVQPATPFAANINAVNFVLPLNSLAYNKTYKWRIVSKNPCLTTSGPIQHFRLIPLPDLQVLNVQAPLTAFSGQNINISWTVKNNGPGRTQTNQTWTDQVYLSYDSIATWQGQPEWNPNLWGFIQGSNIVPLLIATKPNVSALDSGQQYTNSVNFTLPINYSRPVYVFVITNRPANIFMPQVTYANDTARAPQSIAVTLSPTPDLRVDTVLTTASTFSGSTILLTYTVKNYGVVTPPDAVWTDKYYISPTANFNIANAIQLKLPKANEQYYCNVSDAQTTNNGFFQLNANASTTGTIAVVIPNNISGTFFIHAVTNATNTLYEGALNNNNTNSKQIQVYLTPTPVLDVSTLTVPYTNVSTTQPLGINWNINNGGFYDNIEKNQGHYAKQGLYCADFIIGYTNPGNQPIYAPGYYYTDSLGWGSSYWNEKIYLSKDSGNINNANLIYIDKFNHGIQNSAPCFEYNGNCLVGGNHDRNIYNIIKPTLNYPGNFLLNIPDTLSVGNYYIYVLTNADKTVFEYPNVNRYKRSGMLTVSRPDLTPPAIVTQPSVSAGVSFNINYTITNGGAGSVYNHVRRDKIYVSTSPVFNASAQLISTQIFTENVLVGSPVTHTFNYTFPPGTPTSTRYFYVHTNYDSAFKETNMSNNFSLATPINVTIAVAKDLVVSNVQLPLNTTDTVFTLANTQVKYTVTNNGTDSIKGKTWVDSIFVSCTPTFNTNTAFYLGKRIHNEILAAGQNYTDSVNIYIPKFSYELNGCFGIDNTNAYFFVRTNADTGVYEGANMVNNYTASIQKKLINPYIDLIVPVVTGADTATVARYYTTNWNTKNIKYYTPYKYDGYYDGIYFSPDSVFNNNAFEVKSKYEDRRLLPNQFMGSTDIYILPNMPAGDYYVHVKVNNSNPPMAVEKNFSNNTNLIRHANGAAKKIHVNATPLPDITDSIISAPTLLALGQTYNIEYKIKNEGVGVTYPNQMNTVVYLSTTTSPVGLILKQTASLTPLPVGQFYKDSISINIPINTVPGNYVLVINADNNSEIVESNETNNIAYKFVTVYSPTPSDLIVQNVSHPDTAYLGYTIDTLKYIVSNISANNAQGVSSDGLYLTTSNTLDSTATLIGIKNKTINMLPLSNDTLKAQPLVTGVIEGNYNVFVKTDFLNNIVETNKNNNTATAIGSFYVKVKELTLNVLTPNTLATTARYYKLIIPNSLNGSTILVQLKTNDSLTSTNQMYIGKGYIPSAANFDYAYDKPNYGNQDIVITTASAGTYYIVVNKISATNALQTISLKAVKLPFAILNVTSGSGGNTGNVTVKISGSLFINNMTSRLYNGTTVIPASTIYFVNSTTVYVTYNLQGKPLGIYNVELRKSTDSTIATLFNGFSIVPANNGGLITGGGVNTGSGNGNEPGCDPGAASGLNSQLVSEIVLPDKVFGGWAFVIQINYNNPTNVDIPAQTRVLYCTDGFPIAFTAADLGTATPSLHIELSEQGGPPGIIRAGGSGTITVYSKAAVSFPAHTYGHYIFK
jgi:hypothetical protein